METLQTLEDSCAPPPNLLFAEVLTSLEAIFDFFGEISPVGEFHDQGQFAFLFVEDGLPVLDDVGVVY